MKTYPACSCSVSKFLLSSAMIILGFGDEVNGRQVVTKGGSYSKANGKTGMKESRKCLGQEEKDMFAQPVGP